MIEYLLSAGCCAKTPQVGGSVESPYYETHIILFYK